MFNIPVCVYANYKKKVINKKIYIFFPLFLTVQIYYQKVINRIVRGYLSSSNKIKNLPKNKINKLNHIFYYEIKLLLTTLTSVRLNLFYETKESINLSTDIEYFLVIII